MMIKDNLEIIGMLIGLGAVIWRIAEVKNQIYTNINKLKEFLLEENNLIANKLDKHLIEYEVRRQWVDYVVHGLDEKLQHKFQRLADEIKELELQLKDKKNDD